MSANRRKPGVQFLNGRSSDFVYPVEEPKNTMAIDMLVIGQLTQSAVPGKEDPGIRLGKGQGETVRNR